MREILMMMKAGTKKINGAPMSVTNLLTMGSVAEIEQLLNEGYLKPFGARFHPDNPQYPQMILERTDKKKMIRKG